MLEGKILEVKSGNNFIPSNVKYDFFISHASEDKDSIVRPLSVALENKNCKVWLDETCLTIGDSLRRKIEEGISNSIFGIVILSQHFFSKEWPQKELDALFSLEIAGTKRILPIWHNTSKDEVAKHSPFLADKVALNTSLHTAEEIAQKLKLLLPPK